MSDTIETMDEVVQALQTAMEKTESTEAERLARQARDHVLRTRNGEKASTRYAVRIEVDDDGMSDRGNYSWFQSDRTFRSRKDAEAFKETFSGFVPFGRFEVVEVEEEVERL